MSFFDDDEDAIEDVPRRSPRSSGGSRPRRASTGSRTATRVGGGGPRRPGADPAVERRRWVAGGVLVVVVVLAILLISSCQARNTKNSLEDYNNSVSSLITKSDATGKQVFSTLASGKGGTTIAQQLATPLTEAQAQLKQAQGLSVPGQMSEAQSHLLLALQMRVDGISIIAHSVQDVSAAGSATTQALKDIATGTARFYASDVIYKGYAVNEIAGALHGDNIAVGGDSNVLINGGQFLTSISWLDTSFIANELGTSDTSTSTSTSHRNTTAPGQVHGSELTGVSIGGITLSSTGTNIVPGSPAPTFSLSVLDSGNYNQYHVSCTVTVTGGSSAKSSIPETTTGKTSNCSVSLPAAVTPGTYQVTFTIGKVPGETVLTNNTAIYSVEFQ